MFSCAITWPLVIFGGSVVLQPADHDPGGLIQLSWLMKSNCSRSRRPASLASRLSLSVHLPTTAWLRRTVACIVCSSLFVQAETSKRALGCAGPKGTAEEEC